MTRPNEPTATAGQRAADGRSAAARLNVSESTQRATADERSAGASPNTSERAKRATGDERSAARPNCGERAHAPGPDERPAAASTSTSELAKRATGDERSAAARPNRGERAHAPSPDERSARATALLRRQLIITTLGLVVALVVLAFTRSQATATATAATAAASGLGPVDEYVQAHLPPEPGSLRLAYLQLAAAALTAVVALGHAAHVAAFVFRTGTNSKTGTAIRTRIGVRAGTRKAF